MIQIEESNPSFESCHKCIYSDDSEETCILRRCIHAVSQLKECYVPKQRKKGRWIDAQYPYSKCSICGEELDTLSYEANYCPNCGARMEENK